MPKQQLNSLGHKHRRKRKDKRPLVFAILVSFVIYTLFWVATLVNFDDHLTSGDLLQQQKDILLSSFQVTKSDGLNSSVDDRQVEDEPPSPYLTMYGEHRAIQLLASLPGWLQGYTKWNQQATSNQETAKYLALMCLPKDNTCGGLSDRFRSLLFWLLIAKATDRVLCFHWVKPFPLETFLETTKVGIDWRCPSDISNFINPAVPTTSQRKLQVYYFRDCQETSKHPAEPLVPCTQREFKNLLTSNDTFAIARMSGNTIEGINDMNLFAQRHSYIEMMPVINQWQHPDMIGDIFRAFFKPVKSLAQRVNATMTKLGLVENEYVSVHVRARYPVPALGFKREKGQRELVDKSGVLQFEGVAKKHLVSVMDNAIKCGNILAPKLPIFFASDHHNTTKYAISHNFTGQDGRSFRPVALENDKMPMHMDVVEFQQFQLADFSSIFEDLLIMGGSKCVSHGAGSFGSFGAGLTGNRCRAVHRNFRGTPQKCPNDRGEQKKMIIVENEMLFKELPGGDWSGKKLKCNISTILE
jgi:hypothetical protein